MNELEWDLFLDKFLSKSVENIKDYIIFLRPQKKIRIFFENVILGADPLTPPNDREILVRDPLVIKVNPYPHPPCL